MGEQVFGKKKLKTERTKIAPMLAEDALRDFEKAIFDSVLPDYATEEIWDDQYQAHYLDPIRALTAHKAAEWEQEVAEFRAFQAKVDRFVTAAGFETQPRFTPGKRDLIAELTLRLPSIVAHREDGSRFRRLDATELQEYYKFEVSRILRHLRLRESIADRPSDTVERRQSLQQHHQNSAIVGRFIHILELMQLGCLTHFTSANPQVETQNSDSMAMMRNDNEELESRYPLIKRLKEVETLLGELVRREAAIFELSLGFQNTRDSAHSLYQLFSLHKFPNDVSFRYYDNDHRRLLYPTTVLPASQVQGSDIAGICGAVREIVDTMTHIQGSLFLETLNYLIVMAIVAGTRRSRFPRVAASAYVQATERGIGLVIISQLFDNAYSDGLRKAFEALNLDQRESHSDVHVAERFRVAISMLPCRPIMRATRREKTDQAATYPRV